MLFVAKSPPSIIQNIDFVQLVKDVFVTPSYKKFVDYLQHNAQLLYQIARLERRFPGHFKDIIANGEAKYKKNKNPKYGWLDAAIVEEDDYKAYHLLNNPA